MSGLRNKVSENARVSAPLDNSASTDVATTKTPPCPTGGSGLGSVAERGAGHAGRDVLSEVYGEAATRQSLVNWQREQELRRLVAMVGLIIAALITEDERHIFRLAGLRLAERGDSRTPP